ncbi:hypothetical protein GCK72_006612 [Caenorhabditis remanei]|uniref:Uncharacterized protein n=1 Tax=Caenorhabditis remanei TaxID=31234 RepID=A0A6A5HJ84_CAERE|nr:hypothetical protein GCK72_006612 [Caenorhabditis remanei]KAF1766654.1 hypothetical protein GCK72_006612 [Caenorhabditis remanei]
MLCEVTLLIITFPFFASLALVNCLKSHWKFKGDEAKELPSEAYVKAVPVVVEEKKPTKREKKAKKAEENKKENKKGKKLAKFFIFNGKDDELKTPVLAESLSLDSTQDDEEKRPGLQLLPSPAPDMVKKLKARVRRERRGKKSPQDYFCNDEEDSLFNVPSLIHDQPTVKSPRSATVPVDIQDSRILRVNQDRLGYKKSHTIYATRTSVSPFSERMGRLSGSSSGSATDTEPATVIQNY